VVGATVVAVVVVVACTAREVVVTAGSDAVAVGAAVPELHDEMTNPQMMANEREVRRGFTES
jgi:hypothetical protein